MPRSEFELYPDFQAELKAIDKEGITDSLLNKIIRKHRKNALYNWELHKRYEVLDGHVPIFEREPHFDEENPINNKINNDFFGEIVDFKTGFFAGKPIVYSYADTTESKEDTGGEKRRDIAAKVLSDFVTRNNMHDVDMEITKNAAIAGYSGRMFYIDEEGFERVMPLPSYETIILSESSITEPKYGIRYYKTEDINGKKVWNAEFDDGESIRFFEGSFGNLKELPELKKENLFGYCAIQGIPNNGEMLGDAEKVLSGIDAYDRAVSDMSNETEGFANAYLAFENVDMEDEQIQKGQRTGAFQYFTSGTAPGSIHFITKDINDSFLEHHLDRLAENIHRFSKTPDLSDENFSQNASGVALKFKLTGIETKCGMFQAKMTSAGVYMFKLLAGSWSKHKLDIDPLQCFMSFKRNFPVDVQSEATAVSAMINSGLPKRKAFEQYSFVDDVEEIMQLIEEEKDDIQPLYPPTLEDDEDEVVPENETEDDE